jgi:phenylacetate-coenzyme A ligase PaaK-like adenylate-forming protein
MNESAPQAVERLLARARALQESERWNDERMLQLQAERSARLLKHARRFVPYFREVLEEVDPAVTPGTPEWRRIPLLSRATLQRRASALRALPGTVPPGPIYKVSTSGATGEPVEVWRGDACREAWEAAALREHRWHRRDATRSMALIRAGIGGAAPAGRRLPRGMPFDLLWRCGPTHALDLRTDVAQQAEWLRRVRPNYLLTYPANLDGVLPLIGERQRLALDQVIGVGGAVSQETRILCREVLGCEIAANYSSQEAGIMALECPHCRQYHTQSEDLVLEVLDEHGDPCAPGDSGRVVVTDLHNYLMPLIRYEIGDYAMVGVPCSAGIGLPSLREVLGRRRNLLVHADGRRHWPLTGFGKFREVAPVLRFQVVQHELRDIELRVAVESQLSASQRAGLTAILADALDGDFAIRVSEFSGALPEGRSPKFEEFISRVP